MYEGPHDQQKQHHLPQEALQPGSAPHYDPLPPYEQSPVMQQPPPKKTRGHDLTAEEKAKKREKYVREATHAGCLFGCCLATCLQ